LLTSLEEVTIEGLFTHLSTEEKTQSIAPSSTANHENSAISLCPHNFAKSKCFTCTPSSRPTCPLCVSAGLPHEETRHKNKKGHPRLCKNRPNKSPISSSLSSSPVNTSQACSAFSSNTRNSEKS